jgi:pimeloyl-ACP methyl ester carboxylesterase
MCGSPHSRKNVLSGARRFNPGRLLGVTIPAARTKNKGNLPMVLRIQRNLLAALILVGVHMSVSPPSQASPEKTPAGGVASIILVHGAWADGSSWSKVISLLQAKGLHVVAVQIPLTSLADDVAATKRAMALQNGPVVLVGHSYGGL